jgi:hypothetical protein
LRFALIQAVWLNQQTLPRDLAAPSKFVSYSTSTEGGTSVDMTCDPVIQPDFRDRSEDKRDFVASMNVRCRLADDLPSQLDRSAHRGEVARTLT